MPGSPATSPKFGAPRYSNADDADFADQVNGVTDVFDAEALRTDGTETLASLSLTGAGTALNVTNDTTIGGQLSLPKQGATGGLKIGGDSTLYRDAANSLRTGGALTVDGNTTLSGTLTASGVTSLAAVNATGGYTQTGASVNTFSGVTNLTSVGTALSVTNSASIGGVLTVSGQLKLPTAGSGAGLLIGGDSTLYRDAANSLRTSAALTIDGSLAVGATVNSTGGYQIAGTALAAANLSNGVTGAGAVVLARSPTLAGTLTTAAINATGAYTQTGSGANTLSGATTFTASGTAVTINNNLLVSGTHTIRTALTLDPGSGAGTASFTITLTGRSGGTAANSTIVVGTTGTLTYNVPSAGGQTHIFQIGGTTEATISASAFNIAAGNQYQIGGAQIALSNLSNTTTGTGTTVVLSASPALTGAPTAPTAAIDTNTTQLATTAFVATSFAPLASPTLTGQVLIASGTKAAPGIAFSAGTGSGLYRAAANDIGLAVVGADLIRAGAANTNASIGLLGSTQSNAASITAAYTVLDNGSATTYQGLLQNMTWQPTTTALAAPVNGSNHRLAVSDTSATGNLTGTGYYALRGFAVASNATRTLTTLAGIVGEVASASSSATAAITGMVGLWSRGNTNIFNTVTSYYGVQIDKPAIGAGGSIATAYGLYIANQTAGTANWAIYSLGGNSSHAGSFRFGDNTAPGFTVDVAGTLNTSGAATLGSTLAVTGTSTLAAVTATTGTFSGLITGRAGLTLDAGAGANAGQSINLVGRAGLSGSNTAFIQVDQTGNLNYTAGGASGHHTMLAANGSGFTVGQTDNMNVNGAGVGAALMVSQPAGSTDLSALRVTVANATFTHSAIIAQVQLAAASTFNLFQGQAGTTLVDKFYVDGTGTIHSTSTSITAISDRSVKTDIKALPDPLATILALKPRQFKWSEHPVNEGRVGQSAYGLIADEVEEVLPGIVGTFHMRQGDAKRGKKLKALRTGELIPVLVGAVQELSSKVDDLEAGLAGV